MSSMAKVIRVLAVLVLACAIGVFFAWMQSRGGVPAPVAISARTNLPQIDIAPIAADETPAKPQNRVAARLGRPRAPVLATSTEPPEENKEWEKQLDDVLLSDTDANTKADKILALLPTAPASAQVELSQHLVNMVQDDHYDGAAQLLTNSATPAGVSTVLMNDLLNRTATLKLPMLLAVARDSDHPLNGQARDMLELLLQEDNGTNWDQWGASINTWLQDNPQ